MELCLFCCIKIMLLGIKNCYDCFFFWLFVINCSSIICCIVIFSVVNLNGNFVIIVVGKIVGCIKDEGFRFVCCDVVFICLF